MSDAVITIPPRYQPPNANVVGGVKSDDKEYHLKVISFLCLITVLLVFFASAMTFNRLSEMGNKEKLNDTVIESGVTPSLPNYTSPLPDSLNGRIENSGKRPAKFYNGIKTNNLYFPFDVDSPIFPPGAVTVLNQSLQQGKEGPTIQYVALLLYYGQPLHWGVVISRGQGKAESSFIVEKDRIYNLMNLREGESIQLLRQPVGNEQRINFTLMWVPARDADPAAVVSFRKSTNSSSFRLAPALYQEHGYAFLGEADIDNWVMKHAFQGGVENIDKAQFTNNVYLLVVVSDT
ncbi:hypothetical protein WR25_20135 [Diploscapter pachys]|uniref:Uncharacterized protein n=1 Tax=Diploscapter pachys TaxID=2018661 RepID=A0A2A2LR37_9BILA|nr:hypothetical protein WR25_20135 [Diploscapter pachys]